jgi:hypothetical protein
MNLLLDFIETEFGLLPVESPGESTTFLPPFVAFVGSAVWETSIWVSLYGQEREFDGDDTVPGKIPNWRRFHVQNRREDIARAQILMRQACENYKRNQGNPNWDDMVRAAEERWLENRNRELREALYQKAVRDLLDL